MSLQTIIIVYAIFLTLGYFLTHLQGSKDISLCMNFRDVTQRVRYLCGRLGTVAISGTVVTVTATQTVFTHCP